MALSQSTTQCDYGENISIGGLNEKHLKKLFIQTERKVSEAEFDENRIETAA